MIGLSHDTFDVLRRQFGVDSEGDPSPAFTDLGSFIGTWGSPSARDLSIAKRRGQEVDAVISTESFAALRPGDRVINLYGKSYDVVSISPLPQVSWGRVFLQAAG